VPQATLPFETRSFDLTHWQTEAVERWVQGDGAGLYRGTLEIFTGGGKTLIALACAAAASKVSEDLRIVIVVPTIALADQWLKALELLTTLRPSEIGRVSRTVTKASLQKLRAIVVVINTAAKVYASLRISDDTMLIVDECHRAGAPTFKAVLNIDARFKLGLSATPERDEVDSDGEPIRFDEQIVARRLGKVVYSFDLSDARRENWLPDYKIIHHGLSLRLDERSEYDRRTRRVDDMSDKLRQLGVEPGRARVLQTKRGDVGEAARSYLAAVGSRKDLLYRAEERARITRNIVSLKLSDPHNRIIMFNERIDAATTLYKTLAHDFPSAPIAMEHSKLSAKDRRAALDGFRSGAVQVLISAKSLIEGIDVPHANIGVSVASTGSVRQRIQALGRVLRRDAHNGVSDKKAEMHLLYIADTVDEAIYEKEDWSDLTGESLNEYFRWSLDENQEAQKMDGPPRRPKPTEGQEFQRLSELGFPFPTEWLGAVRGQEYRIDTRDNVANAFGTPIANSQGVGRMLEAVRRAPGGKFIVTAQHRLVLVARNVNGETIWYAAGQIAEPFVALSTDDSEIANTFSPLVAGSVYHGPLNSDHGTYKIRSRGGGCIERRLGRGHSQFAVSGGEHQSDLTSNAQKILEVWRTSIGQGLEFHLNNRWDAWYRTGGVPQFIANVPNGFEWSEESDK
jgi:superfamily II DNA or RNA helicase